MNTFLRHTRFNNGHVLSIDVYTTPYGKGRPRFNKNGTAYTPQKTKEAEQLIHNEIEQALKKCMPGWSPIRTSISMTYTAYFGVPKSWTKGRKALTYGTEHTSKPDLDNLLKLVMDACNEVLYLDDSQIYYIEGFKVYCEQDEEPHISLTLRWTE